MTRGFGRRRKRPRLSALPTLSTVGQNHKILCPNFTPPNLSVPLHVQRSANSSTAREVEEAVAQDDGNLSAENDGVPAEQECTVIGEYTSVLERAEGYQETADSFGVSSEPVGNGNGLDLHDSVQSPEDEISDFEFSAQKSNLGHYCQKQFPGLIGTTQFVLWSLLQTNGSRKLSVDQYNSLRSLLSADSESNVGCDEEKATKSSLPHYRTLSRTLRPFVLNELCVLSRTVKLPVDLKRTGARLCRNFSRSEPMTLVQYVSPLEYAVADVQNRFFLSENREAGVYSDEFDRFDVRFCSENAPIVQNRERFYGEPNWFEEDHDGVATPISSIQSSDAVQVHFMRSVECSLAADVWSIDGHTLRAHVACIFEVLHYLDKSPSTSDDSDLAVTDFRSLSLKRFLRRLNYSWPSSNLSRSEVPAIQPSDAVAVLRPLDIANDDRILLVFRFLCGLHERPRFMHYVSGQTILPSISGDVIEAKNTIAICSTMALPNLLRIDVRSLERFLSSPSSPPAPVSPTAPTLGVLSTGERYAIYRFFLYVDGFQMHVGNRAGAEGIYIQPISISATARNDSSSARVLAIVPAGVDIGLLLNHLVDDIVEGMTSGRLIIDAEGKKRRVFLDLVGILGDTPGLNALLDVTGHTGIAPCHRCSFDKQASDALTNEYLATHGCWSRLATRRTSHRHRAVHLMSASAIVKRSVDVKTNPSNTNFTFRKLRDSIVGARCSIPKSQLDSR